MTDAELLAEGAEVGTWLPVERQWLTALLAPDDEYGPYTRKGMLSVVDQALAWGQMQQGRKADGLPRYDGPPTTPVFTPKIAGSKRVAFVGGLKYEPDDVDSYLAALKRRYPDATVVTGHARGAETQVAEKARELGFTVEQQQEEWWPDKSLQVEAVLMHADAIVVVGSETAQRAAAALRVWKRVDGGCKQPRPLVKIAAPPAKETAPPKRRPTAVRS